MNFQNIIGGKIILGILIISAVLIVGTAAQGATIEELLQQIADLQARIAQLQQQLAQLPEQQPQEQQVAVIYEGIPAGFSFEKNLAYEDSGNEVKYLQIILKKEGVFCQTCQTTGYFGYWTWHAVKAFQEKYASEILFPVGLTKGNAFVGKTTQAKLNALLGEVPPSTSTPTPTATPSPTTPSPTPATTTPTITLSPTSTTTPSTTPSPATTPTGTTGPKTSPCSPYGDINNDGFITSDDSQMIAEYLAHSGTLTDEQRGRAEVTGDGKVDINDAMFISQYAAGTRSVFPVCACSDGTRYGQCSATKPKYCQNGTLINKCSQCGCGSGLVCKADETCGCAASQWWDQNGDGRITCADYNSCVNECRYVRSSDPAWNRCYKCDFTGDCLSNWNWHDTLAYYDRYNFVGNCPNDNTDLDACPASEQYDINNDGAVTTADLEVCSNSCFGKSYPLGDCDKCDFNGDCTINIFDSAKHGAKVNACDDGTRFYTCSLTTNRLYCNGYQLIEKCSVCGCPYGAGCLTNETCGRVTDLDVTYIERTPKYDTYKVTYFSDQATCQYPYPEDRGPQLCPGEENKKRWPDNGEQVTFTAHIINKGTADSGQFSYKWFVDGIEVKSGTHVSIAPEAEATETYQWTWTHATVNEKIQGEHKVKFVADSNNQIAETSENNNIREEYTNALSFFIWAAEEIYGEFNSRRNSMGSYSFEDWIQEQFKEMGRLFSIAPPNGIQERVSIDKIIVIPFGKSLKMYNDNESCNDGNRFIPPSAVGVSDYRQKNDGLWGFGGIHPDFARNTLHKDPNQACSSPQHAYTNDDLKAFATHYFNQFGAGFDYGLIHELTHQLGIIDLYQIPIDRTNNQVSGTGYSFPYGGLMGGGDTRPYLTCNPYNVPGCARAAYSSHTAVALNKNLGYRRGYYGEYLFDIPRQNTLKILGVNGNPIPSAEISVYQKARNDIIDTTPEYTGETDSNGNFVILNNNIVGVPVAGYTSKTNHTLRANPFGNIDVVGHNGLFLIKIVASQQTHYQFLDITQFNLEYWKGNTESAVYTINAKIVPGIPDNTNLALNKPATASGGLNPNYANDGDKTTIGQSWEAPNTSGSWWKVDLGSSYSLYKINIYPHAGNHHDWFAKFHIEVSTTGAFTGEQTTLVTETNWDVTRSPNKYPVSYIFNPTQARYVRIVSDIDHSWAKLQEVEIFKVVTPPPAPATAPASSPTATPSLCDSYGDVNEDGGITTEDTALIDQYLAGTQELSDEQQLRADVNQDSKITSLDSQYISEYITGARTALPACSKTPPCGSYGDVNDNGYVNLRDANLVAKSLAQLLSLTDEQKSRAEVTGDGSVTISDAMFIAQYTVGTRNTFPVCQTGLLKNIENQLASISEAASRLMENIKKLMKNR